MSFSLNSLIAYKKARCFLVVVLFSILHLTTTNGEVLFLSDSSNCNIDSILVVNPVCNGQCNGSAIVYAQGSNSLFYQWPGIPGADSSFISGLCAGTYTVIITDSTGCTDSGNVVISEPSPILFNFIVSNSTCPGGCSGTITVQPFDTVPYSYQWPGYLANGPVLGNLCVGTYSVIITDSAGCTTTGFSTVSYDAPFQLTVTSTPATCLTSCDGTATVVANGVPPFSYQWETGPIQTTQSAFNLCLGNYIINVTDSTGCVVSDTATVGILPPLTITHSSQQPTCFGGCNGSAEIFIATPGNYYYEWNTFPVQDSTFATGLCSGIYLVFVTDVNSGCVFTDSIEVTDPDPPLISFTVTPSACENICSGTAFVQSNGIPPFSYLWQSGSTSDTDSSLCPGIWAVTISDSLGCSTTGSVLIQSQELLFNTSDASCNAICDGTAEVILPPGSWQILWDTNPTQNTAIASGLCGLNYTVSIEDSSGCILTQGVEIGQNQPINSTVSTGPVSCPGICDGFAAVTATGNGPFSYLWNTIPSQITDTVYAICQGSYLVTITDSTGCSKIDSIEVSGPEAVQFSFGFVDNSCENLCDGSAVITPSVPGNYIYEWLTNPVQFGPSAASLCPGYSLVIITDTKGCVYLDSVLIIGPAPVNISFTTLDVSCIGQCDGFASCIAMGGTPGYNYQWSNGFVTPQAFFLCADTFTVTVTDQNGCFGQSTVSITEPDSIDIVFNVTDASCQLCNDGSVTAFVSGGVPSYYYFWTPGNVADSSLSNLLPGIYTLCVTDNNSCIYCEDAEVSFFNYIAETLSGEFHSSVYPNPFSKSAVLKLESKSGDDANGISVLFYDITGRVIHTIFYESPEKVNGNIFIDLKNSETSPGIYFYSVLKSGNPIAAGKCVISSK